MNEVKNLQERHDGTKDFGEKWALEEDIIGKVRTKMSGIL